MAQVMTVSQAIAETYLLATGKTTALDAGSPKYQRVLALLNVFTNRWAKWPSVQWRSLRTLSTLPSVISTSATYTLPANINRVSQDGLDYVTITSLTGQEYRYEIVPVERARGMYDYRNDVSTIAGQNLLFHGGFSATDPRIGGTIKVPAYLVPTTLVNATDVIQVDDPNWLCYAAAAEYCRNDITRVQLYPSLRDESLQMMAAMIQNNDTSILEVARPWSPMGETW